MPKRCEHTNCKVQANYGVAGGKPTYCSSHAPDNYENVKAKRCDHTDCKVIACYGEKGKPRTYCAEHALDNMKNWDEICKSCGVSNKHAVSKRKKKHLCMPCHLHAYPEDVALFNTRNLLVKERAVYNVLQQYAEEKAITIEYNVATASECGKRRPDFTIDCYTHVVIIEVDELQHRRPGYQLPCETTRDNDLWQSFNNLYTI